VQLPLHVLHAEGDLRQQLPSSSIGRAAQLRGDRTGRPLLRRHGVTKLRLTGGEPLLRKNIEDLVGRLAAIPTITDVALTTNGALLARKAIRSRAAGLHRVTVSLDSLDDATFMAMNDVDFPVAKVLDGIDAAAQAGLGPIKINMVVKRGVNDGSVVDMAAHFQGHRPHRAVHRVHGRRATNGWELGRRRERPEIVGSIGEEFPLEPSRPTTWARSRTAGGTPTARARSA
jgi:GTP 3',8-cyclase